MPAGVKGASVALGMAEVPKHGNVSLLPSASLTVHPQSSGHSRDLVAIVGGVGWGGQRWLASYSCFNLKRIPNTHTLGMVRHSVTLGHQLPPYSVCCR